VGGDGVARQRAGCGIVSFFFFGSDLILGENIAYFDAQVFGDINQLYSSDTATEQVERHFTDVAKANLDSEWRESAHRDTYLYSTYTLLVY
jgi:hypothetical protein